MMQAAYKGQYDILDMIITVLPSYINTQNEVGICKRHILHTTVIAICILTPNFLCVIYISGGIQHSQWPPSTIVFSALTCLSTEVQLWIYKLKYVTLLLLNYIINIFLYFFSYLLLLFTYLFVYVHRSEILPSSWL